MKRRRLLRLLASCLGVVMLGGCERQPIIVETAVPETQLRLIKINSAYNAFIDEFGQAPRNEKDLLSMLANEGAAEENHTTLLTSSDGSPFVVCYGVNLLSDLTWAKSTPILAYESGAQIEDGKRWVLAATGAAFQISEADFRLASFPPGHTPILKVELEESP